VDRYQIAHGWTRSRLYTSESRVVEILAAAIRADVGRHTTVRWRREGVEDWTTSPNATRAAHDIVDDLGPRTRAQVVQVRGGPTLWKYVAEPPAPGYVPAAALETAATRRTLRFHTELHLAVPLARPLGLYVARPLRSDIPAGWEVGDPWPAGAYASEHPWAAADDAGGDNTAGTGYAAAGERLTKILTDVTAFTLANYERLGVRDHIFDGRRWRRSDTGPAPKPVAYHGDDPHDTHTHTAFADHGGRKPPWL
jgi:hypothetical protein